MSSSSGELVYRQIVPEWAGEMAALEVASFPTVNPEDLYTKSDIHQAALEFPEGCFAVFDGETIVGMGLGLLLDFDFENPQHDLHDVYRSHRPEGSWYYGTTIAVNPAYRGRGIGRSLYDLRKGVVQRLNRRGIVAGGVLPGYAPHRDAMSAAEYIDKVSSGELYDSTLTFQIENGFQAKAVLEDYFDDPSVGNNAVLIVWDNPDFQESDSTTDTATAVGPTSQDDAE